MIGEHVKPGATTEELDRICHDYIVNVQGTIPANVGYRGYPKTLCTSVNNVICHGIPNEAKVLKEEGVDFGPVPPRYKLPYFSHIMGGYAAGYYAYIWSEVLAADTVEWLKANGGLKRANGDQLRAKMLSRGGSEDAMQLFRNLVGHEPDIKPLLERRGLVVQKAQKP
jgi:hypothetical protein